ncbi:hypothetical protein Aple_040170 [Acrocarpospora pleiomorpha]|uniref:CBM2 domain-containing protein n=1 Tax=Acrocarpospora pleiomorpha TaxID=90975 RepID=A0A5M3XN85_9ACTN|nr:cellulose binding domain-containing protein [Acrocarpospora pleiomorpha]GES21121.1 hypothetical protein Aple_040170 [Acrocarpospora pleiomorpha]
MPASAYVGPRAAVYGNSTVSGNARIEGMAWVNSGATVTGNAIVRDSALVQGGANLSGNVVVGGDAEPAIDCGSGTYLMFNPDRGCNGAGGEADVNPAHGTFTDADLTLGSGPSPSPSPSPPPPPSPSPSPSPGPSPSPSPSGGARTCSATYVITNAWQGGFQGDVTVRAGSSAITGWTVTWTYTNGQAITQSWNAMVTSSGAGVTAGNVSWNGSLGAGATTAFGFLANAGATNSVPALTCTARWRTPLPPTGGRGFSPRPCDSR